MNPLIAKFRFLSDFHVQNEKITIFRNFSQFRFRNFSQSQFDFKSGIAISQLTQFEFEKEFAISQLTQFDFRPILQLCSNRFYFSMHQLGLSSGQFTIGFKGQAKILVKSYLIQNNVFSFRLIKSLVCQKETRRTRW